MRVFIILFLIFFIAKPVVSQVDLQADSISLANEVLLNDTSGSHSGFFYGYGVSGIWVLLPVPFAEGGLQINSFNIRTNIGYDIAYLEARAEISYIAKFTDYTWDVFVNYGIANVIEAGFGKVYNLGINIIPEKENRRLYYKFEFGFYQPGNDPHSVFFPRVGIGWRFYT